MPGIRLHTTDGNTMLHPAVKHTFQLAMDKTVESAEALVDSANGKYTG